ncbi:MAG: hypothetical protein EBU84_00855 [Actinobacteria bacterium]|jgi:carbamoyltransferase|nr:hypothetical protein [Actinomycetota bacterium]
MITVGFSCSHDSGVAVLEDSKIVFASNEERYSRTKFQSGFPIGAVGAALEKLDGKPIDNIVMDGQFQSPHGDLDRYNILENRSGLSTLLENQIFGKLIIGTQVGVEVARIGMWIATQQHRNRWRACSSSHIGKSRLHYVDHHVAHGASSALLFRKGPGHVLTLDAIGEGLCSRILLFDGRHVSRVSRVPAYHSMGLLYAAVNRLLGFKPGQEGKVTGLAAHGNADRALAVFERLISWDSSKKRIENKALSFGYSSIKVLERELAQFSKADIAAGVQAHLEQSVINQVKKQFADYPTIPRRLYVAGGVFANVSLNRRLAEDLEAELYVCPNMGDGGLGLGAALLTHDQPVDFSSLYLGDEAGSVSEHLLETSPVACSIHDSESMPDIAATDISSGKVIAVARGRMEFGPRALGNRSILARADDRSINQWLNNRLSRTEFMPFAPIVRDVDASEYFVLRQGIEQYENMTTTCMSTELARRTCEAIVHLDGTARPQVVSERRNPWIFRLLTEFKKATGCGVLINTSFNIHEEPIVRTANDAFASFLTAQLDVLYTENQRISKI